MATQNMQAMQLIAPDIAQEQNQLARRQQMADLLRKQSLEPDTNTEVINGWAVKKSPLAGLSKIAQALGANYIQGQTDDRQLELAKALQGRMRDAFDNMAGGSVGSGGMVQPQMEGRTDPSAMGPQTSIPAPNAVLENSQMQALKNQAKAAYLMGNNELSNKLIENYSMMTDTAKRDRELGITAPESKASELAKRLKDGTMSLLPNQTNILPDGTTRVAPDFAGGFAGGFNAQGQPVANEIPGSAQIAANRAGMIKNAELAGADRFAVPVKVDAAEGPMAMTPSQQRRAANNGVDPANPMASEPARQAVSNPLAARPGETDQSMILRSEMTAAQGRLASATTPDQKLRAQDDVNGLTRELGRIGVSTQPVGQASSAGIKLQDDSSRKFGEQIANKSADSLLESRDKAKAANDSLVGIQQSRQAIAGGVFQGSGADFKLSIAKFINANIPGVTVDPEKVGNTDYLKSTLGAGLLAEAKTLGTNPSNADATRLNDIVGSVGKDPQAMAKILDWRQMMAERSINNHNSTVADAEKRGMSSPYELRVTAPEPIATLPAAQASAAPVNRNFAVMPNPAEFSGKRMRAPDGTIIRSNGKSWVKE